jgi:MoxR-like ATPase
VVVPSHHQSFIAALPPGRKTNVLSSTRIWLGMTETSRSSDDLAKRLHALRENVGQVFLGKPEVIRLTLVALLADGHLLLEDVPGVGKTLLGKALARSLSCKFARVQFTPDLLPGDLLGVTVYREKTSEFVFQPGPLFTEVLLADEINRATPRTQSALLEAMSERQVTVDAETRRLGPPFLVIATQNPHEFEGTYPLPESQLDRFMLRVKVGYPERDVERAILTQHRSGEPVEHLQPVLAPADVLALQAHTRSVRVDASIADYILDIVNATRSHSEIVLGASTRASLALYRAVQALAVTAGRDYVIPDDVKLLAEAVVAHRLVTRGWTQGGHADATPVVREIVAKLKVPT